MTSHIGMKLCNTTRKNAFPTRGSRNLEVLKTEIRAVDIRMKQNVFQLLNANTSFQSVDSVALVVEGDRMRLVTKGIWEGKCRKSAIKPAIDATTDPPNVKAGWWEITMYGARVVNCVPTEKERRYCNGKWE